MAKKNDLSGWFFDRLFIYRNKYKIFLFNRIIRFFCKVKGVKIGENVILNGSPLIRRIQNSNIIFGNNCEFNSAKHSVPIGLSKPCTFVTLRENAEIIFGNNSGATGSLFVAASKIQVGNDVMIGANCTIIDNDFHNSDPQKRGDLNYPTRPITIEDNVFIGFNCFILKGVTIGKNSVIGANSVVINNIPKNTIAIGNPCKVVITKKWD